MDPIMGSIMIFGGTFAPRGWALCNGQLMSIAQNTALFSIIGTTYGGDGITTFGLPDLRGRVCLSAGQGPGLPPVDLGQMAGSNTAQIAVANLPTAPVSIPCSQAAGSSFQPAGNVMASTEDANEINIYGSATASPGQMIPGSLKGGNQPLSIQPPYNVMNWCIALEGIYPSRP